MDFYLTKYALCWPFQIPFEWFFYRSALVLLVGCVALDLASGSPHERCAPGIPKHFFYGNAGDAPHHLWQYQDGWTVPNMSGARHWCD